MRAKGETVEEGQEKRDGVKVQWANKNKWIRSNLINRDKRARERNKQGKRAKGGNEDRKTKVKRG